MCTVNELHGKQPLPGISSAASLDSVNGKGVSEFLQTSSHLSRKKGSGLSTKQLQSNLKAHSHNRYLQPAHAIS